MVQKNCNRCNYLSYVSVGIRFLFFNTFLSKIHAVLFVFNSISYCLMSLTLCLQMHFCCYAAGLADLYCTQYLGKLRCVGLTDAQRHTHNEQQQKLNRLWLQCDCNSMWTSHRCQVLRILPLIWRQLSLVK